jgi:prepilin-type N-terminal cleavage/methylation domain-containing protein
MVFKTTCIKSGRRQGGFTLVELLVASAIGLVTVLAIASLSLYTSRSFAALSNYLDLDERNRQALDNMSREVRQVHQLTAFNTNSITFEDYDGQPLRYNYDPAARALIRTKGAESTTLLTGCDTFQFFIFQRTPISNKFEPYPTANIAETKAVELRWKNSRQILGAKANTENMQSAIIVIRQK